MADTDYLIRDMTLADLDAVVEIERKTFTTAWSRDSFAHELSENPYCSAWSAEVAGGVVGYLFAWVIYDELHIANLAVSSEYRGRGIGRQLMERALQQAETKACTRALLEVAATNSVAINLYDNLGFHRIGLRRGYYAEDGEDAVLMERLMADNLTVGENSD